MGDNPEFLATNLCHTDKRVSINRSNRSSPLQKKCNIEIYIMDE